MISSEEAKSFLESIIQFKNWKEILERDKVEFLKVLVPHFAHNIYFHNVALSSVNIDQRRVPSEDDIISAGLNGIGGACITQNTFLTILLKALEFNSYLVSGYVHGPRNYEDNHVICIVEFSPETKYLLDLGVGLPFADPVPMHALPYTQTAGGFRYQYKEAEGRNGVYYRVQIDGALFGGEFTDKNVEYVRYEFTMKPVTVSFFEQPLRTIFTDADNSNFLRHPFMFRYFEEDEHGNVLDEVNVHGDRKWILIRGVSVLIGTDHTRAVTHYSNYNETKDIILKYFPKFRPENVEKSIQLFNQSAEKYGYSKAN